MNNGQIQELFEQINVWKRGEQRAPHKPLLLLFALGKCSRGEGRQISYREVDEMLRSLLEEFGPARKSYHTEYPFWRLQNDGIWELSETQKLERRASNTDAKKRELLKYDIHGGFIEPIFQALYQDRQLQSDIATLLLEKNFPATLHDDICEAVGFSREIFVKTERLKRDPNFRPQVLNAYAYRCAICGFDIRLGQRSIGMEAAHIKWHQAGGPDIVNNGLALCVMHHKLLDLGAVTLSDDRQVLVSDQVNGYRGVDEWIIDYHGSLLNLPENPDDHPNPIFLKWHRREVFKGRSRNI